MDNRYRTQLHITFTIEYRTWSISMQNKSIYRKDYKPYSFKVISTHLTFALYDDDTLVENEMKMKRERPGKLCLYGQGLELLQVKLNGKELSEPEYHIKDDNLIIDACPDEFTVLIRTRIYPHKNTTLSGLYRTGKLFSTQCEAEGFRCITFFPDRPDVLTTYRTHITAEKKDYPILLSNGNCIESGTSANGRHWAIWDDPFKKPSYLFALVAGDLACITDTFTTQSGRNIDLRIYVEKGNEGKCAFAMTSLKKAMRWDEENFGREYDLDTYMMVAVNDFNFGAMENKGLTIFDSRELLATPETSTDGDYAEIENVIGHEYFHNWTGNRITCRDWFQLSLKEGLTLFRDQEFSSDMNSREVNRIFNVRNLLNEQFPEDKSAMAHPVRPESYIEINNFYTSTVYNKGAEIIRMQRTLLGKEGFRKGMDLYFKRYDGQAVTIDDFVSAMEEANHIDLSQFKRWYSQAGTPEVTVDSDYSNHCLTLKMKQTCPPTPESATKQPFHIPICMALFNAEGKIIQESLIELKTSEAEFRFEGIEEKPIVSLLRGFSAPIKLHFNQNQESLLSLILFETDGYAKWNAAQSIVIDLLHCWIAGPKQDWSIPEALLDTYRRVLKNNTINGAIRAYLLEPPTFDEVTASLKELNVTHIETIRDAYQQKLGQALFPELEATYKTLWDEEDNAIKPEAYARRALRNTCLRLMMKSDEKQALPYCQHQFQHAKNMTDNNESLCLLADAAGSNIRKEAIETFYNQWSKDDMVLDKWFAAAAQADLPDILEIIKKLMRHQAFDMKNPNKMHALVGTFTEENLRHFHAIDGSGYIFLREVLLELDKMNPQVAVQLATPLTLWQRLDKQRQKLIRNELEIMAKQPLSRDLGEIVTKSLAVNHGL